MNPVLMVASERREFAGLLRRAGAVKERKAAADFLCSCELGGQPALLVANGPGPKLAAGALSAVDSGVTPRAVVSVGFCGALDPAIPLYGIIAGGRVQDGEYSCECSAPVTRRAFVSGTIVSLDHVVVTEEEKVRLRTGGGAAVEMEAAAVGRWAAVRGIPFFCAKIVTDRADEGFAIDFNQMRDQFGRFSRSRIAARAMRSPVHLIPELIRLAQRSREAAILLGDFLADCRF